MLQECRQAGVGDVEGAGGMDEGEGAGGDADLAQGRTVAGGVSARCAPASAAEAALCVNNL